MERILLQNIQTNRDPEMKLINSIKNKIDQSLEKHPWEYRKKIAIQASKEQWEWSRYGLYVCIIIFLWNAFYHYDAS
jgi:hypothetical protein